jgi:hypothetical protein
MITKSQIKDINEEIQKTNENSEFKYYEKKVKLY